MVVRCGGLDGVDVDVEVEVEVAGVEVVLGDGVEAVVVVGGGQDSDTLETPVGSDRLEIGAPTGSE